MATQSPAAQEAASRERIIKHMNADHQDSVRRYLEHLVGASSHSVSDARITHIDNDGMKLTYSGKSITLPFSPPLASLREARERLVQMDKDAINALGRHPITIKEYLPPRGAHLANFTICLTTYILFSRQAHFHPGSLVYGALFSHLPSGFVGSCAKIQPWLFSIMVSIHLFETALMRQRMKRHSVVTGSGVWWAWILSCFVEGITSFKRIDAFVRRSDKAKH